MHQMPISFVILIDEWLFFVESIITLKKMKRLTSKNDLLIHAKTKKKTKKETYSFGSTDRQQARIDLEAS